jgi:FkbM family methyltransferase
MHAFDATGAKGLIYDVGAHKGEDTEYYLRKGFSVVAIEPNPELYAELVAKFRQFLDCGRLILLDASISDTAGETVLYVNANSAWATTDPEWVIRNQKLGASSTPVIVKSERFKTILQNCGMPYYLKIDIEGADTLCLDALKGFSSRPQYVSIESTKTRWRHLLEEFSLLSCLGYCGYKIINQGSGFQSNGNPIHLRKASIVGILSHMEVPVYLEKNCREFGFPRNVQSLNISLSSRAISSLATIPRF